jgi:tetratricopeptide (TPR) repeat protein
MGRATLKESQLRRLRELSDAKPGQTVRLAEAFLRVYPEHGPTWVTLGIARTEMAQYAEARKAFRSAIRLCPPDLLSVPYAQLGHLYKQKGDLRSANRWYRKAIDASPNKADGYIYSGAVLALRGKLKEAETQHRLATRCSRGCIDEAFLNLGLVLRAQEKYSAAAACFRRALALDPAYAEAKRALADVAGLVSKKA